MKKKTEFNEITNFKKGNNKSSLKNKNGNSGNVLKKTINNNQKMWIVGTGISKNAPKSEHFYSDPTNQFWNLLYQTEITKNKYTYFDDVKLVELSIGLTDFFPSQIGIDKDIDLSNFKTDIDIFINDIKVFKPILILFNGKLSRCNKKQLEYIKHKLNNCKYEENKNYFFCCSSSGSANKFSEQRLREWQHVANIFNNIK